MDDRPQLPVLKDPQHAPLREYLFKHSGGIGANAIRQSIFDLMDEEEKEALNKAFLVYLRFNKVPVQANYNLVGMAIDWAVKNEFSLKE